MKINICMDGNPINGYTNVDPLGRDGTLGGDYRLLDNWCEDAEAREIRGDDVLNYLHASEVYNVLKHYVSKLRRGGRVVLGGTDFFELAKQYTLGQVTLNDVNKLVHGELTMAWLQKRGCYEPNEVAVLLKQLGLRLLKKRVNGKKFVLEAIRD